MTLPSYGHIVSTFERSTIRTWCARGECQDFDAERHTLGVLFDGTLHWADRKPTRAGIKRFGDIFFDRPLLPEWQRLWLRSIHTQAWAAETLYVRLGRGAFEKDRVRVRYLLGNPNFRGTDETRQAWEWAR